jgi:hypothetical protein
MSITPEALASLLLELAELRNANRQLSEKVRELESQVYGGSTK